jgi:hypothetical protein
VFRCLHEHVDGKLDWGVVFFDYHNFAAFRVQTMVQVPWDPLLHRYGSKKADLDIDLITHRKRLR